MFMRKQNSNETIARNRLIYVGPDRPDLQVFLVKLVLSDSIQSLGFLIIAARLKLTVNEGALILHEMHFLCLAMLRGMCSQA